MRKAIVTLKWEEWIDLVSGISDFVVKQDQDWVFAVTGYEGSGKSLFVLNTLYDIYNKKGWDDFTVDKITFTSEEYIKVQNITGKGKAIQWDEVGTQLFSRESTKKEVKQMIKIFITNRWRNLLHFLCIPSFKWLDIYMREMRVRSLIRVVYRIKKGKEVWKVANSDDLLKVQKYGLERYAYLFTREDLDRLINLEGWWKMLKSWRMIERFGPSFKIEIPDWNVYREGDKKYWGLVEEYEEKKKKYQELLDIEVLMGELDRLLNEAEKFGLLLDWNPKGVKQEILKHYDNYKEKYNLTLYLSKIIERIREKITNGEKIMHLEKRSNVIKYGGMSPLHWTVYKKL